MAAMHRVIPRDFGLRCTSNYKVAKPFNYPFVERFVNTALSEFAGHGIGPNNFARNVNDGLFGYVVSFSLFAGNATFVLNRDGLISTLSNGQSKTDAPIIRDLLQRALNCLPSSQDELSHEMLGFCHGELEGGTGPEQILRELMPATGPNLTKPSALSVVSDCPSEANVPVKDRVWLEIAASIQRDNHLFMGWHFGAKGKLNDAFWSGLGPRLDSVARGIGLEIVIS